MSFILNSVNFVQYNKHYQFGLCFTYTLIFLKTEYFVHLNFNFQL